MNALMPSPGPDLGNILRTTSGLERNRILNTLAQYRLGQLKREEGENLLETRKEEAKSERELKIEQHDFTMKLLGEVNDEASYQSALAAYAGVYGEMPEGVPETYDPGVVDFAHKFSEDAKERLQKGEKFSKVYEGLNPETGKPGKFQVDLFDGTPRWVKGVEGKPKETEADKLRIFKKKEKIKAAVKAEQKGWTEPYTDAKGNLVQKGPKGQIKILERAEKPEKPEMTPEKARKRRLSISRGLATLAEGMVLSPALAKMMGAVPGKVSPEDAKRYRRLAEEEIERLTEIIGDKKEPSGSLQEIYNRYRAQGLSPEEAERKAKSDLGR